MTALLTLTALTAGICVGWISCRLWHASRWEAAATWGDDDRRGWHEWLAAQVRRPAPVPRRPQLFDGAQTPDWHTDPTKETA